MDDEPALEAAVTSLLAEPTFGHFSTGYLPDGKRVSRGLVDEIDRDVLTISQARRLRQVIEPIDRAKEELVRIGPSALPRLRAEFERCSDEEYEREHYWLLGRASPTYDIADCLAAIGDTDSTERVVAYALRARFEPWDAARWGRLLVKLGHRKVQEHLRDALSDPSAHTRARAASLLGGAEDASSIAAVIEMVRDPDDEVRIAVANALGDLGEEEAVQPLIAMTADAVSQVRQAAVTALGKLGCGREELTEMLTNDEASGVRAAAVAALGQLGDPAVDCLARALSSDGDSAVREAAAIVLAKVDGAGAIGALVSAADGDEAQTVRLRAALGIAALGDHRAFVSLAGVLELDGVAAGRALRDLAARLAEAPDRAALPGLVAALERLQLVRSRDLGEFRPRGADYRAAFPTVDADLKLHEAIVRLRHRCDPGEIPQPGDLGFDSDSLSTARALYKDTVNTVRRAVKRIGGPTAKAVLAARPAKQPGELVSVLSSSEQSSDHRQ